MRSAISLCVLSFLAVGCQHDKHHGSTHQMGDGMAPKATNAIAIVQGTKGNEQVRGVVRFQQTPEGVRVLAEIEGLKPNTKHGFHVHEFGDLSDMEKGASVGSHFDPLGSGHHGGPADPATGRHGGDMGNIQANDQGKGYLEVMLKEVSLVGKNAIVGRAVVVHEKEDDFGQPVGNAGGRIGLGLIGVAK